MSQFDELPEGWIKTNFGDVVHLIRGITFPSSEKLEKPTNDSVICLRTSNVQEELEIDDVLYIPRKFLKRDDQWIKVGDIVISMANSYELVGKVARAKEELHNTTIGGFISIIRPLLGEPDYFFYLLCSRYMQYAMRRTSSRTVNIANISLRGLQPIEVPLPPVNEQRRIVEKIEALTARSRKARTALDEIPALLDQFRQSVLAAAFRGDLTADWRAQNPNVEPAEALLERIRVERRKRWEEVELEKMKAKGEAPRNDKWKGKYKEPKNLGEAKIVNLRKLPETWCWLTWEEILSANPGAFKRGPFGSALKKSIFVSSGYKVYEQYCPINDDCSYARYYITPDKFEELKSFSVKSGDFLISCSGVTLGRITQVPDNYEEGVINQALLRVRLHGSVMLSKYFIWLFRSPFFQKKIFENATGSAIPNVKGVDELKAIPIPLPPIREQAIIIGRVLDQLKAIDEIEKIFQEAEVYLNELDQSILAKAFRGELVPQDPNDEPAAVLLDRIRAERERLGSGKKRSKAKG